MNSPMAPYISCPHCTTVFAAPAELPAHGKVRCGVCSGVLEARLHGLYQLPEEPTEAAFGVLEETELAVGSAQDTLESEVEESADHFDLGEFAGDELDEPESIDKSDSVIPGNADRVVDLAALIAADGETDSGDDDIGAATVAELVGNGSESEIEATVDLASMLAAENREQMEPEENLEETWFDLSEDEEQVSHAGPESKAADEDAETESSVDLASMVAAGDDDHEIEEISDDDRNDDDILFDLSDDEAQEGEEAVEIGGDTANKAPVLPADDQGMGEDAAERPVQTDWVGEEINGDADDGEGAEVLASSASELEPVNESGAADDDDDDDEEIEPGQTWGVVEAVGNPESLTPRGAETMREESAPDQESVDTPLIDDEVEIFFDDDGDDELVAADDDEGIEPGQIKEVVEAVGNPESLTPQGAEIMGEESAPDQESVDTPLIDEEVEIFFDNDGDDDDLAADRLFSDPMDDPDSQPEGGAEDLDAVTPVDEGNADEDEDATASTLPGEQLGFGDEPQDDGSGVVEAVSSGDDEEDDFVADDEPASQSGVESSADDELRPVRASRWRLVAHLGIIGALVAIIVGQLLYLLREPLQDDPLIRPWQESLCAVVGCQLPQRRDTSQLGAIAKVVISHPKYLDALRIDLSLANRARFAQPFPTIRLVFLDKQDRPVAGRDFVPSEYLLGPLAGKTLLQPMVPEQIVLQIKDPGPAAVNYRFSYH